MPTLQTTLPDETVVRVPAWVVDNSSYFRWAESDAAPEKATMGFLNGTVWVDPTMEQIFHNLIKQAVAEGIRLWIRTLQLGHYYGDGLTYSSLDAEFTTVPDGIFVSHETLKTGKVQRKKGIRSTAITGSPDMVLEVVSRSSVDKDVNELKVAYFEAGIPEYWLIDSRLDEPTLQILRRGKTKYRAVANVQGWVRSDVLSGSFRLKVDLENEVVELESR
jgi:Uma2 family endonuclease